MLSFDYISMRRLKHPMLPLLLSPLWDVERIIPCKFHIIEPLYQKSWYVQPCPLPLLLSILLSCLFFYGVFDNSVIFEQFAQTRRLSTVPRGVCIGVGWLQTIQISTGFTRRLFFPISEGERLARDGWGPLGQLQGCIKVFLDYRVVVGCHRIRYTAVPGTQTGSTDHDLPR